MIRFAWLQARTQTLIAAAALAAAAVVAAVTGPRLLHFYDTQVLTCHVANDCTSVTTVFLAEYRWMQVFAPPMLLVLPALIGMFWGAPLIARELETGTFRMAWTQSVTRQRWLAVKLVLLGLASMAVTGLLSLILTWWFSPLDRVQLNPLDPSMFGVRGIVPVGYAAFAFALGVTAGSLLRRTIPAMAVTLVAFTAARLAVTYYVRPYIFTPLKALSPVVMNPENGGAPLPANGPVKPGALVISDQTINGAGQVIGQNGGVGPNGSIGFSVLDGKVSLHGVGPCPNTFSAAALSGTRSANGPSAAFNAAAQECITKLGIRQIVSYQPLDHYWPLQWFETLIFLGLAVALAGLCFWRVRRSLT